MSAAVRKPRVSEAEERLRVKTETALRKARPDARIIHELVLTQGGERIDLAAVWPDGMILAEVKSERDTLTRLPSQLSAALSLGCEVWLALAERWRSQIDHMLRGQLVSDKHKIEVRKKGRLVSTTYASNPDYVPNLWRATLCWEADDHLAVCTYRREVYPPADGAAMLDMLWAEELRAISGTHKTDNRTKCINAAREFMTGQQVRRAACAALMARSFPRADPPVGNGVSDARGLFTKQKTAIAAVPSQTPEVGDPNG